jgi:hypothetical protein
LQRCTSVLRDKSHHQPHIGHVYDLDENLLFHGEADLAGTRITVD